MPKATSLLDGCMPQLVFFLLLERLLNIVPRGLSVAQYRTKRARIFCRQTLYIKKNVRLGQIRLAFFFKANCPTAKNPRTRTEGLECLAISVQYRT